MIHRAHHLQDQRLLDSYLAERGGASIDPPAAEHLADCDVCGARYAELAAFLDTLRRDGDAEADEIFTPERLQAQHQQIARRIAHVGRPARVLSFPTRLVQRTINASTGRATPRWIAGAAAAGLFVGVAVGASVQWAERRTTEPQSVMARDTSAGRLTPAASRDASPAEIAADTAFLSDLEAALERPHTRELQAFDELTPHFREIRDQR